MCEPSPPSASQKPSIEALHRDIALANQYRLELIKLVMTLSGAILAFTVSFRPSLKQVDLPCLMWAGWLSLGVSMIGGMVHMLGWDRFYVSYRDYDYKGNGAAGKTARSKINVWRRIGMFFQYAGFGIGVIAIAAFAAANLGNVFVSAATK